MTIFTPTVQLRLQDLKRAPEFHLDQLLDLLASIPDGYRMQRLTLPDGEPGWELDLADGYTLKLNPQYQCGWEEAGAGPLLTTITSRLSATHGRLRLNTRIEKQTDPTGTVRGTYTAVVWDAKITLGGLPLFASDDTDRTPRTGCKGEAKGHDDPGIAALVAYLRAWGVLE